MNGLHACKPGNEPQVGQVKTFLVEQRVGKSGKAYTKIKSATADQGGLTYRITAAKPTGHTDSYGNVSFNLDIEPANGGAPSSPPQREASPAPRAASQNGWDDRSSRIERQSARRDAVAFHTLECSTGVTPSLDRVKQIMSTMESWLNSTASADADF